MMEVKGIKCDHAGCGYEDMTVPRSEYENYLNKPCPQCGSSLLTPQDYAMFLKIERLSNHWIIKTINKIGGWFGAEKKTLEVEMNGTGSVNLKEK